MTQQPKSRVLADPPGSARQHVHLMVARHALGTTTPTPLMPATLIDPSFVVLPQSAAEMVRHRAGLAVLVPGREQPLPVVQVTESHPEFGHVLGLELAGPVDGLPLETPSLDVPLEEWLAGCDGVGPYDGPVTPHAERRPSPDPLRIAARRGGLGEVACKVFHKRGCKRCR